MPHLFKTYKVQIQQFHACTGYRGNASCSSEAALALFWVTVIMNTVVEDLAFISCIILYEVCIQLRRWACLTLS